MKHDFESRCRTWSSGFRGYKNNKPEDKHMRLHNKFLTRHAEEVSIFIKLHDGYYKELILK